MCTIQVNPTQKISPVELAEVMTATVRARNLFRAGHSLVLALSGGPDSTALARLLVEMREEWRLRLVAVHVNYGLRGDESDGDERFVRELCEALRIDLVVRKSDAALGHRGESLQMAARRVRYAFLEEERSATGADRVVTGHNRDDRAETVLLNLFRGAGPRGLGAIPYRRGPIVRPLLDCGRGEIRAWLSSRGHPSRADRSNRETHYDRNRVRLELVPFVEKALGRNVGHSLARAADVFADVEDFLEDEARQWLDSAADRSETQLSLPAAELAALPRALARQVVRAAIHETAGSLAEVRFDHVERVVRLAGEEGAGKIPLPIGGEARREAGRLILGPPTEGPPPFEIPLPLPGEAKLDEHRRVRCRFILPSGLPPEMDAETGYFDADRLTPPLVLRSRLPGDRFRPLGAPGSRKVQDLMVDRKVPRAVRGAIPIVADGEGILWVWGLAIADRAKITPATANILEVAFRQT